MDAKATFYDKRLKNVRYEKKQELSVFRLSVYIIYTSLLSPPSLSSPPSPPSSPSLPSLPSPPNPQDHQSAATKIFITIRL